MTGVTAFDYKSYLAPRYWPTWLAVSLLYLLSRLPRTTQISAGRALGSLLSLLLRDRRQTALTNLKLAFPSMESAERTALMKRCFQHIGITLMETASLWYRDPSFYLDQFDVTGFEHLKAAQRAGKGVLILQAHFVILDASGPVICQHVPVSVVVDPPKNRLAAALLKHHREKFVTEAIDHHNIRSMIRRLRNNEAVWYSPDLFVHPRHGGIPTTYFGVPAMTTDGIARITRLTGAVVVPYVPLRHEDGSATLAFQPPLWEFDVSDPAAATQQINDLFEAQIRARPDQYLWIHRRFKRGSKDQPDPYRQPA